MSWGLRDWHLRATVENSWESTISMMKTSFNTIMFLAHFHRSLLKEKLRFGGATVTVERKR